MQNPITTSRIGYIVFGSWWGLVAVAHFLVLYLYYNLDLDIAAADSLVFNGMFAAFSVGLWFWVSYTDFETQKIITIAINHVAAAAVSLFIWVSLSGVILSTLYADDLLYLDFLTAARPLRVVTGLFLYLFTGLTYYLIIYIQNFREKVSREAELQTLVREAELNWLKLQINPHFLFNSLNSISSLTMSDPDKAQDMIIRLSELLRYSLRQSPESLVPISQEIENCTRYLEIEKVRFGKRLNYTMNVPEAILGIPIPAMILQPLFENAIKHGVAASPEAGEVNASIQLNIGSILVTISNDIFPDSAPPKGSGVGLANISRRLSLLYGQKNLVNSRREGKKYVVELTIPLIHRRDESNSN
jgi:sensor histidine kinase YesM